MRVRIRRFGTLSPALGRMFDSLTANEGFTTSNSSVGLHPIQKLKGQFKLVGWCITAHEVCALLITHTVQAFSKSLPARRALPFLPFRASVPIEWTDCTCLVCPLLTSALRSGRLAASSVPIPGPNADLPR